ncbi:MAG TPA: serine hydrolase, partial [Flavisolibacter sp.]
IEQLLQQTSGLDFVEDYRKSSDVTRMLFQEGDMAGYAMKRPLKHAPGTVFNYSGGNTNLLSYLVRRTAGSAYHRFPYEQLFHRIGMYHAFFEPDASGTYVGSSYIYATARDYARFGWLYANDGVWNGTRVLPEGWVRRSATSPAANKTGNYGFQFWLNGRDPEHPGALEFPGVPADMFYADGFGGQRIYIIPSMKLVLVRLGLKLFDEHAFLKRFLLAFEKGGTNKPLSSHPL